MSQEVKKVQNAQVNFYPGSDIDPNTHKSQQKSPGDPNSTLWNPNQIPTPYLDRLAGVMDLHQSERKQWAKQAKEAQKSKATKEPKEAQPYEGHNEFFNYKSGEDAARDFNAQKNGQAQAQESAPQLPQESMQPTSAERWVKGFRNTGVAYFDNKKDLTLLDAYFAKQLGLDVKYLVHKVNLDMNANIKARNDSLSKVADNNTKQAYYADTLMRVFGTQLANDKSGLSGALTQGTRNILQGNFGIGEASEQKALNNYISAMAMKSAGGSTQISQTRYDMIKKEMYQGQDIEQKSQVIASHLRDTRDALIQNRDRALAAGSREYAQIAANKIKEIDMFLALQASKDYENIGQYLAAKTSWQTMPEVDELQKQWEQTPANRE